MNYERWENEKQSIRDKIEELFAVCEERGVHDLHFEVDITGAFDPHIEYKVGQHLLPKEEE